jgi:hypothetical protein
VPEISSWPYGGFPVLLYQAWLLESLDPTFLGLHIIKGPCRWDDRVSNKLVSIQAFMSHTRRKAERCSSPMLIRISCSLDQNH